MLTLYFDPTKFPRTIDKIEWKEIWRWKRMTQKKLIEEMEKHRLNLSVYGSTMPDYIKVDLIDKMLYPPLLIHGKQTL